LSVKLRFAVGAVALLIFREAIVMFALFFIWCLFVVWPGVGGWVVALLCSSAGCVSVLFLYRVWGEFTHVRAYGMVFLSIAQEG
jgi:hypothetical protein